MPKSKRLLWFVAVVSTALGVNALADADDEPSKSPGNLIVSISNIQEDRGQVGCSLFSTKDGFPSQSAKAEASMFVKPKSRKARCTFKNIKPGKYAVSVMHDADKDGKLKTTLVGRPQEWWGVSNNIPAERFGPPKYEAATFDYGGTAKTIQIRLRL